MNLNLNMNNNLFLDNNNSFLDNNNSNYFSNNNNVIGLIEDIDKLHFNDNDNNEENEELKNILNKSNWTGKKENENSEEKLRKGQNELILERFLV